MDKNAGASVCKFIQKDVAPTAAVNKRKWDGWKQALDDELQNAGGTMPWKQLRDALVARGSEAQLPGVGVTEEELGHQALANVPACYLSKEDTIVRFVVA